MTIAAAAGQLFFIYNFGLMAKVGNSFSHVPWERESDPTERIQASTLAGQFTYQIQGPGDLEESPETATEHDPGTSAEAQAMARWSLHRAAKIRAERAAREEDLPETCGEGPYQESEPWYEASEENEYDEYDEYSDGDLFAPTVDQAVQADSERHGVHPDLRWDSAAPEFSGEADSLAYHRDMLAHHTSYRPNSWISRALGVSVSRQAKSRLEGLYRMDDSGTWQVRRDAEATRHMARGAATRNARYTGFLGILHDVDLSCQAASKAGKGSDEATLARQGLAWVVMLWGQYVVARASSDQKRLADLCPVLKANQLYLTWGQRKALDQRRTALLTKWARVTGLSRQEANSYHVNAVAPTRANEYRGAHVDYSTKRRSDSVTHPMGTKASMMPLQWYPRRKRTEPVKICIKGFRAYLTVLARMDVFQQT